MLRWYGHVAKIDSWLDSLELTNYSIRWRDIANVTCILSSRTVTRKTRYKAEEQQDDYQAAIQGCKSEAEFTTGLVGLRPGSQTRQGTLLLVDSKRRLAVIWLASIARIYRW